MDIVNFNDEHCDSARRLARLNYLAECGHSTFLPADIDVPELTVFAENNLGVAAFEGGEMIGFLCCYGPIDNFFGNVKGVFSPVHAHGAISTDAGRIYSQMYRKAAEKWVANHLLSHAIALYFHDTAAIQSFFHNGFGMRCIDSAKIPVRRTLHLPSGDRIEELHGKEREILIELKQELVRHFRQSPVFMPGNRSDDIFDEIRRYFVYRRGEIAVAMIGLSPEGETFVAESDGVINICDACSLPEFRGTGIMTKLLQHVENLAAEKKCLLAVDFESLNPDAFSYWLKHFSAYSCSLNRRIDERVCT